MNDSRFVQSRLGVTLVEVLIAVAIISIIVTTVASLYVQSGETTMFIRDRSDAMYKAQEGVERMIDKVRNSDGLTSIGTDAFTITNHTATPITSTFSYSSTNHTIMLDGAAYTTGITTFTVTYLDSGGIATTLPADVTKMVFAITATVDDTSKNLDTSVSIRRLTL